MSNLCIQFSRYNGLSDFTQNRIRNSVDACILRCFFVIFCEGI